MVYSITYLKRHFSTAAFS